VARREFRSLRTGQSPPLPSEIPDYPVHPNQWGLRLIRAPEAWQVEYGDAALIVALLEDGFDIAHPDLRAAVWRNPSPGKDGEHGWNFVDDDDNLESDVDACTDHGCHVASIICAGNASGGGVYGVAPGVTFMPLRIHHRNAEHQARAISYAVDHGARIIHLNWGVMHDWRPDAQGDRDLHVPSGLGALREAVDRALDNACLLVGPAADERPRRAAMLPQAYEGFLNVNAADRRGGPAWWAGWNGSAQVIAPGGMGLDYDPTDIIGNGGPGEIWGCFARGRYGYWQGCGLAAAHVTGLAALILSRHPEFDAPTVRQIIRNTATGEGFHERAGHGLIDCLKAIQVDRPRTRPCLREDAIRFDPLKKEVTVRVANEGVLDAPRLLLTCHLGRPGSPGSDQIWAGFLSVPGRESVRVSFTTDGVRGAQPVEVWATLEDVARYGSEIPEEHRFARFQVE